MRHAVARLAAASLFAAVPAAAQVADAEAMPVNEGVDMYGVVLPYDGATVATNVVLYIEETFATPAMGAVPAADWDARVAEANGADPSLADLPLTTATDIGGGFAVSLEDLAPESEYVAVAVALQGGKPLAWRFHTSAAADHDAPAAPEATLKDAVFERGGSSLFCGVDVPHGDGYAVTIEVTPGDVDEVASYELRDESNTAMPLMQRLVNVGADGSEGKLELTGFIEGYGGSTHTLSVKAMDAAGNESTTSVDVALAEVPEPACACAQPSSSRFGALGAAVVVGLGALLRRRRR